MTQRLGTALPAFVAAIMTGVALWHMPFGYYTAMRWVACITAVAIAWYEGRRSAALWVYPMIAVAIMFNPIAPVHLGSRSAWMPIDIGASVLFVAYGVIALRRGR